MEVDRNLKKILKCLILNKEITFARQATFFDRDLQRHVKDFGPLLYLKPVPCWNISHEIYI
jgi:hypothetical protein